MVVHIRRKTATGLNASSGDTTASLQVKKGEKGPSLLDTILRRNDETEKNADIEVGEKKCNRDVKIGTLWREIIQSLRTEIGILKRAPFSV